VIATAATAAARLRSLRPVVLPWATPAAGIAPALVALAVCAEQLSQPHAFAGMHGADDGIYLAPALRLIHGAVPYRDYVFVHPPGIVWLMTPLGVFGDTRYAMAAARVLTALAAGANASLAAFLVRAYGRVAMLVAGLALALFPVAVSANHTLTLDPFLLLFCLLGALVLFRDGDLATSRRIGAAGALFGFAGAIKTWAVFPAIAAVAICLPYWRSALRPFAAGLVAGFGIPSLPFFLLAPGSFVHDVLVAQVTRRTTGQGYHALTERLTLMLGLGTPYTVASKRHLAEFLTLALIGVAITVFFLLPRRNTRFELYVLGATAVTGLAMAFVVKEFYEYYAYFPAGFGVVLLGVCAGRLVDWARSMGQGAGRLAGGAFAVLSVVALVLALPPDLSYARRFSANAYDPRPLITAQIPKGSCVVFDEIGNLIDSNRLFASRGGCPQLVDAFGMWLADNKGIPPPAAPVSQSFVATWRSWFERADYAVLGIPHSDYVPWTPELVAWFNQHYRLAGSQPYVYVYRHVAG
jgi:hypothetical protein